VSAVLFHDAPQDLGPRPLFTAVGPPNGPPLVLLHGVLRGWRDFAPLWPALLPRWQLVGVDQRGHGRSGRTPGRYHVRDYAADAVELVNRLGEVVLYGHSLGALVSAHVAAAVPWRVKAVVLEDPPAASMLNDVAASPWHAIWAQMRPLAGRMATVRELMRELAEVRLASGRRLGDVRDATSLRFSARCLQDLDPAVFDPLLESRWLEGFEYDAAFAGVQCPALILRGDEALGGMLSKAEATQLAALMADGDAVDVPGAGHLIHWQAAEATARLVLGFLESL
jgi:pimeloyl-ACP methyl ester carboxylesterase